MKSLPNTFLPIVIILILMLILVLAIEILSDSSSSVNPQLLSPGNTAPYEQIGQGGNFTYFKLNDSMMAEYAKSKSNKSGLSFLNMTYTTGDTYYWSSDSASGFSRQPDYPFREDVIVYFKEMPSSVDNFASSYGVKPIFVKGDIKMAAFETSSAGTTGLKSEKTITAADRMSKDPLVEAVKIDTYMFINKSEIIDTKPEIVYPADLDARGIDHVSGRLTVGFWRLPPSLKAFGERYGGVPEDIVPYVMLESVVFETANSADFIDRASKDPYVRSIFPPIVGHISSGNYSAGLP